MRAYTNWLKESPEYVRFVNPGDLRVATETCGTAGCHTSEVRNVPTSMMTTGGMLWGAALYNNGAYPYKDTRFGESYARDGTPQTVPHDPAADPGRNADAKACCRKLTPLERWEISQPGNVLRVFERGGGPKGEVGDPLREEEAGKPDDKLSTRGFGTQLRTDPVFLGLQKTRLLDPLLSLPGTNDQPGRLSRQRLLGAATWSMPMTARPSIPATYAQFGNMRTTRLNRSDDSATTNPAIRSATYSRARSHPASAWCATSIPARTW